MNLKQIIETQEKGIKMAFAENSNGNQYYFNGKEWIKCDENKIQELYWAWVIDDNAENKQICDYLIFYYKNNPINFDKILDNFETNI